MSCWQPRIGWVAVVYSLACRHCEHLQRRRYLFGIDAGSASWHAALALLLGQTLLRAEVPMDCVAEFLHEVRAKLVTSDRGRRPQNHRVGLVDALLAEHQHEPILEAAFAPYLRTIASGEWRLAVSDQTHVREHASELFVQ